MSASKQKGTRAETALVRWANEHYDLTLERRALTGTQDMGDIAGIPGVVIEVKNSQKIDLAGWLDEAMAERINAKAGLAIVVASRRGKGNVGDWYALVDVRTLFQLLDAGDWL